jgi:hypothetical protein
MADTWEYRTVDAGTFELDRLLAQGWCAPGDGVEGVGREL